MCGITAIFSPTKKIESCIAKIHSTLNHRGSDNQGIEYIQTDESRYIYLLHHRLSVLDLSEAGKQPMFSHETGCHIIFNGEIYNFRKIREELQNQGYKFISNTDTEVILQAYARWGKDCVKKFNGMFAFILWDPKKNFALVARDRFGEKPLYFAKTDAGQVIFSSEIKAILSLDGFVAQADHKVLSNFLIQGTAVSAQETTPFSNIYQVPSSSLLILNSDGNMHSKERYWKPIRNNDFNKNIKTSELSSEFLYLLTESVKMRVKCDVQVGAFLSGGLDSTSIVGMLMQDNPENFSSTISVNFENDLTISETKYLQEAIRYFNGNHHMIQPTGEDLLSDMENLFWHQEYPLPSASMFLEWSIAKKAKSLKNVVMLDGQGADELLGGYPYYFSLYQQEMLFNKSYYSLAKNTYLFRKYLSNALKEYDDPERRLPSNVSLSIGKLYLRYVMNLAKDTLRFNNSDPCDTYNKKMYFSNRIVDGLSKDTLQEQLHSADRNGMAFGIETRFPFLDYNLVDFCLKLPLDMLISNGMQKYIVRQSMQGIIPESIRLRKDKLGFLAPQDTWLNGPLKEWSFDMIDQHKLDGFSFFNRSKALKLAMDFQKNPSSVLSALVWRHASFGQWVNTFGKFL